jgi:hypothetical protein
MTIQVEVDVHAGSLHEAMGTVNQKQKPRSMYNWSALFFPSFFDFLGNGDETGQRSVAAQTLTSLGQIGYLHSTLAVEITLLQRYPSLVMLFLRSESSLAKVIIGGAPSPSV